MPIFPLDGILAQPGIEERISQACWTGIYPALTPAIKVIQLPSTPDRVVVAVDVRESIEAPHAIENTTKVYIRNASTMEPIEFAEIDRIEYLLNRRRDPERRREQMIEAASRRTTMSARCIRITIGPKYPYRPLFSREELDKRLSDLRSQSVIPWPMRRIQHGRFLLAHRGRRVTRTPSGSPIRWHFPSRLREVTDGAKTTQVILVGDVGHSDLISRIAAFTKRVAALKGTRVPAERGLPRPGAQRRSSGPPRSPRVPGPRIQGS